MPMSENQIQTSSAWESFPGLRQGTRGVYACYYVVVEVRTTEGSMLRDQRPKTLEVR